MKTLQEREDAFLKSLIKELLSRVIHTLTPYSVNQHNQKKNLTRKPQQIKEVLNIFFDGLEKMLSRIPKKNI